MKKTSEDKGKEKFFSAVGRRKTAIARVRLFTKGDKGAVVNGKSLDDYFHNNLEFATLAASSLSRMKVTDKFRAIINVSGGGLHAQAEAIRHATARALVLFNPDFRKRLKRAGFLTRDSRMVERKKYGLKKARRAPQWQKR
ncbi:MAG: 30S ribosomal protein S9 [Candidatus Terrybacteria bacterium RIFCSPLOWO2_01_FULL_44_24]|uniref:Small ribosomal subunit protein uS9 n=1 Tax=Candidatus Terrybacteria bacterium RIFCSPHIGHO2_01_FULL_43_35 TaxID=1802361 RepID=A0A1G2PFP1_9BACT|nr:MAG: 30S ribosomal protein S9 [Candidatus Terrybacteria bacterium RIFCSPHIGHO2_01_FULL_43_35]OHA49974.1 MAG: 30S ribosomal protein S9 [Candidatus Terrybacteria bacterium RIFCSPHIGHO2_02_FULL_43_14]OHA51795.1 MAG: 30S ribosomal protein S9 [Candidatus Terrybacteria bacterium RIFCSPLOWO2_01_FULL_44_24]